MLTDVFALVLLQLALGVAFWTAVTPSKSLSGGFFVLHGATVSLCLVLVRLVSGHKEDLLRKGLEVTPALAPRVSVLVALGAAVGATLVARLGAVGGYPLSEKISFFSPSSFSRSLLFLSFLFSAALLFSRATSEPYLSLRGIGPLWLFGGLMLGAFLFGAVYWAMNVGHWYLVSTTLPFGLLVYATEAFALFAVLRAAYAAVALGAVARVSSGDGGEALASLLDPMRDGFFFWSRVLWGLAAPLILAPFVVKTARMKSNQAATGLLYVGLVFVLVGELLAAYLTRRSGLPA